MAKINLSDILHAVEFIDNGSMKLVLDYRKKQDVFETEHPFYAILEVASNNDPEVVPEESERLLSFIELVGDHILDGILPQGETQANTIWDLRENIAPASTNYGYTLAYDVSLGSESFYNLVERSKEVIAQSTSLTEQEKNNILTVGYGHIGDGNLHL